MNINKILKETDIMTGPFPVIDKNTVQENPLAQFEAWFNYAVETHVKEPQSMVLSTITQHDTPDSRVVLLKAMDDQGFFFETAKARTKVEQLAIDNHIALNFYWREHGRQIRLTGTAELTREISHVANNLDAATRDLNAYKVIPEKIEFYQALNEDGYTRIQYTLQDNKWQHEWV